MKHRRAIESVCLALFCLSISVSSVLATTVTNTSDSGPGSLRQAIADAPAGGTVDFALGGCPCTIVLTSGDLAIEKNLAVIGPGAGQLTISGNNSWRPFVIGVQSVKAPIITVVLDGLTMTNGLAGEWPPFSNLDGAGGGILAVRTNLTVSNSVISNSLAAQYGGGTATFLSNTTIFNSTISGNTGQYGGGVSQEDYDTLTVVDSAITDNIASGHPFFGGAGGGIYSSFFTTLRITNSTIARNQANFAGAAYIFQYTTVDIDISTIEGNRGLLPFGGTLVIQITTANITNCTISGNTSAGQYYNAGITHQNLDILRPDIPPIHSRLTVTNTTVANNESVSGGGGVITSAELPKYPATTVLRNSIVARNSSNPNVADVRSHTGGNFESSGYNLIGDGGSLISVFNQPGDQVGIAGSPIDPASIGFEWRADSDARFAAEQPGAR